MLEHAETGRNYTECNMFLGLFLRVLRSPPKNLIQTQVGGDW